MNITEIHNLKLLDIIQKRDRDGYIHVGMISGRCLQGTNVYEVMFETVDNGVEFRWYSIVHLYGFSKV